MAPRGHPDDEIIGYEGGIGLGGSVSLRPVRAGDRYRQGRGCCLGTVALLALGIVAAWVLQYVVARHARPPRGAPRPRAAADARTAARTVAIMPRNTPQHPEGQAAASVLLRVSASVRARGVCS